MPRELSWKAKRVGNKYCAPACGRGCTYAEYKKAVKESERLANRLGKGWKPRVWENLGWHYSAVSKSRHLKVYPGMHKGYVVDYTAFFSTESSSVGGRWCVSGKTPKSAVKNVIDEAQREANTVTKAIEKATKDMET